MEIDIIDVGIFDVFGTDPDMVHDRCMKITEIVGVERWVSLSAITIGDSPIKGREYKRTITFSKV